MKNLAGVKNADETIRKELEIAGIPIENIERNTGEVPYTIVGKIGNWTFRRAWYYWIVSVEDAKNGLPLKEAMEMHNKRNPSTGENFGNVIRSGGHCDCPSPDEYGAQPIYDAELDEKLKKLGYKTIFIKSLNKEFVDINVGEVSKICNEGKLDVERYVECYHVDDQSGLNEITLVLKKFENILV